MKRNDFISIPPRVVPMRRSWQLTLEAQKSRDRSLLAIGLMLIAGGVALILVARGSFTLGTALGFAALLAGIMASRLSGEADSLQAEAHMLRHLENLSGQAAKQGSPPA